MVKSVTVTVKPDLTYREFQSLIAKRNQLARQGLFFEDADMRDSKLIFHLHPELISGSADKQAKMASYTESDFIRIFQDLLPGKEIQVFIEQV